MKYKDYLKDANKAVDDAFKEIVREAEAPYWQNFNSKPWYTDLDNDPEAQDYFIKLGDR